MNSNFKESSNKQIAKNTLFLYLRMALIMLMSLISVRLILKALQVEDYGIYNAVGGVVTSLSFLSTVLAGASQRFFSYSIGENNVPKLNKDLGSILLVYVIIIVFIIICAETIGLWFLSNKMNFSSEKITDVQWVYQLSLATFIINLISAPLLALIIAHEDMKYYSIISISDGIIKLLFAIILFIIPQQRLIAYSLLLMIASIITTLFYFIVIRKNYPYLLFKLNFDKENFKTIFSFSSWSCFGSIANVCYHQGINILFNIFIGPIANASFAIANQVNAAANTFGSSFFLAVRPGMIKSYAQGNSKRLNSLYYFSSKMIFFLLFLIVLPLLVKTEFILRLWLGETVEYMTSFTRIMLVSSIIMALGMPMTTIIQATGTIKYYHLVVDGFITLGILAIYFALKSDVTPVYSLSITIIIYFIAHFFRLLFLKHLTGEPIGIYLTKCLLPMILIFSMNWYLLYVSDIFLGGKGITEFIYILLLSVLINVAAFFIVLLNKQERHIVIEAIYKFISKYQ